MSSWLQGRVEENHHWNDFLFSLRIRTEPYDFIPGQFVRLELEVDGQPLARAYTLVNAPGEAITECYVNLVDGGSLSPHLQALHAGDDIRISQPAAGFFVLDEVPTGETLWLLATGTGIAPYLSMLQTPTPWQRFSRIHLVHSVRRGDDLAYGDRIAGWLQKHPGQFRFQAVVTREDHPRALDQRLDSLIETGQLEEKLKSDLDDRAQVMLCGNPAMIRDCLAVLKIRGLTKNLRRRPGQVTVERFWH